MMNVWSAKPNVSPAARSFENPSCASRAMRIPRATTTRNSIRMAARRHGEPWAIAEPTEVVLKPDQRRAVDRLEGPVPMPVPPYPPLAIE